MQRGSLKGGRWQEGKHIRTAALVAVTEGGRYCIKDAEENVFVLFIYLPLSARAKWHPGKEQNIQ